MTNVIFANDINSLTKNLVQIAKENNSQLKSQYNLWQAEVEKIGYMTKLPNPNLSFGYFLENIETAVGPQEYKIGISQKLPWFGKLQTSKKIQILNADIRHFNIQKSLDEIEFHIKESLYNYYYISEIQKITQKNLSLLNQWNKILESKYQTSSKSYTDVIKIHQEIFKMEELLASMEKKQKQAILSLESITESKINNLDDYSIESEFLNSALENIHINNNPDLQILKLKNEIARLAKHRANQEYIPDAGIALDYILTGDKYQSDGTKVKESGINPFVLMFSLELPLQFRKISKNIKSKEYHEKSLIDLEMELRKNLFLELEKMMIQLNDLQSKYNIYNNKIIPKSEQIIEIQMTELASGKIDIFNLIETQRDLLRYKLKLMEIQRDHSIVIAKISKIIGSDEK